MNSISQTMEATMYNTSMEATSADQMSSTINGIAKNSEQAREISVQAVRKASTASKKMVSLGTKARSVGAVNDISEQTNLLALIMQPLRLPGRVRSKKGLPLSQMRSRIWPSRHQIPLLISRPKSTVSKVPLPWQQSRLNQFIASSMRSTVLLLPFPRSLRSNRLPPMKSPAM
jgi:hypothetical protein